MRYSILVNSCDKYSDLWQLYFKTFKRFWPQNTAPIYLNTETKNFSFDGLDVTVLHSKNDKQTWSQRLIYALERIDTEFVLFTLDDFILESEVNHERFLECCDYLEKNKDVGMFQFVVSGPPMQPVEGAMWSEKLRHTPYRINAQMCMWRKKFFLKVLRKFETPWEFEKYGSIRSRRYKEKICAWNDEQGYVFEYGGTLVMRGKWDLDEVDRLQAKLGIQIDLGEREGEYDYFNRLKNSPRPAHDLKWIWNKLRHIRSLI